MAEFRIFILFQYRVGILQSDQPHPSLKFHMINCTPTRTQTSNSTTKFLLHHCARLQRFLNRLKRN